MVYQNGLVNANLKSCRDLFVLLLQYSEQKVPFHQFATK